MAATVDREWVEHYHRCAARARAHHVTRLSAGQYFTRNQDGRLMVISRIDEGRYRGQWLVSSDSGRDYSDPIEGFGEAREIAWNWP